MANVTQAIKEPKIKKFLDKNFPKPKIVLPNVNENIDYYTPRRFAGVEGTMIDIYIKLNTLGKERILADDFENPDDVPLGESEIVHQVMVGTDILTKAGWGSLEEAQEEWEKSENLEGAISYVFMNLTGQKKIDELNSGDYFALAELVSIYRSGPMAFISTPPRELSKIIDAAVILSSMFEQEGKRIEPNDLKNPDFKGIVNEILATLLDFQNVSESIKPKLDLIKKKNIVNGGTIETTTKTIDKGDWDILVDKSLLDIKNTKDYRFTLDMWRQLITYYLLSLDNFDIKSVGIWYTRFNTIYEIDLADYFSNLGYTEKDLDNLISQFKKL